MRDHAEPVAESKPAAPPNADLDSGALQRALRQILRPLVRLLISKGIPFTYASNLLKSLYVEVADRHFPIEGKRQTDSRLSLLTGVHRKDIKVLRSPSNEENSAQSPLSLGAQAIARWLADYPASDGGGQPLPRLETHTTEPSFQTLIQSVSNDIRPRAVLDEWLRLGIVRTDAEDRICLNVNAFVPEAGSDDKAGQFGRNLHDHMAAGVSNLIGGADPFLERSVHYNNLSFRSVEELAALSEELGMEALKALNRRARKLQNRDSDSKGANQRMTFGTYFYNEPDGDPNTRNESKKGDDKK